MSKNQLYPLPSKWEWQNLESVLIKLESGKRPKGGVKKYLEGIPSIGAEHLANHGEFNFKKIRYVPQSFYEKMNQGKIKELDVLVVKDGATTGKVSIVTPEFPYKKAAVNEHVFILRGNPKLIDQYYLFYFLFSSQGQLLINSKFQGSAQGGINTGFVENFPIPLPSLKEQRLIVLKILGYLKATKLIRDELNMTIPLLKKYRESILNSAFSTNSKSENTSKELKSVPLSQLLREPLRNGKSGNPIESGKGIPVLKLSAVTFKDFSPSNVKICDIDEKNVKDLWVQHNDIFISRSNSLEYVGMGALYEGKKELFIFPDLMIRVRVNEKKIFPKFLAYYLDFKESREHFQKNAKGSAGTMPKISQPHIENLHVRLPTLEKQKIIIKKIEEYFQTANQIRVSIIKAYSIIDEIENSIFTKIFRGSQ